MSSRQALKTTPVKKPAVPKPPVKPVSSGMPSKRSNSSQSIASDNTKTRRHLTSVLDINISQARCQRHLKLNLCDNSIAKEIKALRELLKGNPNVEKVASIQGQVKELSNKLRVSQNPEEKVQLQSQIDNLVKTLNENPAWQAVVETTSKINDLTKKIVRLSSEVSVVVATMCDFIVDDIITFAMDYVLATNKKQVQPQHLVAPGIEGIKSYPFIRNLPVFVQERARVAQEQAKLAAARTADATTAENPAVTDDSESDADDSDYKQNNFVTYVTNAICKVKQNDRYATMRISLDVRKYLSNLIICFIKRISNMAQIIVQDISDVRTLNPEHVVNIIKWILRDEQSPDAVFQEIKGRIEEKLVLYKKHNTDTPKVLEDTTTTVAP